MNEPDWLQRFLPESSEQAQEHIGRVLHGMRLLALSAQHNRSPEVPLSWNRAQAEMQRIEAAALEDDSVRRLAADLQALLPPWSCLRWVDGVAASGAGTLADLCRRHRRSLRTSRLWRWRLRLVHGGGLPRRSQAPPPWLEWEEGRERWEAQLDWAAILLQTGDPDGARQWLDLQAGQEPDGAACRRNHLLAVARFAYPFSAWPAAQESPWGLPELAGSGCTASGIATPDIGRGLVIEAAIDQVRPGVWNWQWSGPGAAHGGALRERLALELPAVLAAQGQRWISCEDPESGIALICIWALRNREGEPIALHLWGWNHRYVPSSASFEPLALRARLVADSRRAAVAESGADSAREWCIPPAGVSVWRWQGSTWKRVGYDSSVDGQDPADGFGEGVRTETLHAVQISGVPLACGSGQLAPVPWAGAVPWVFWSTARRARSTESRLRRLLAERELRQSSGPWCEDLWSLPLLSTGFVGWFERLTVMLGDCDDLFLRGDVGPDLRCLLAWAGERAAGVVWCLPRQPHGEEPGVLALERRIREGRSVRVVEWPGFVDRRAELAGLARQWATGDPQIKELVDSPAWDGLFAILWRQAWQGGVAEFRSCLRTLAVEQGDPGAWANVLACRGVAWVDRVPSRNPDPDLVAQALRSSRTHAGRWNKSAASRLLGWDSDTLGSRLKELAWSSDRDLPPGVWHPGPRGALPPAGSDHVTLGTGV
ncbi:MAG: hypothetical protein R3F33_04455 [Planctomycetota bacterium]